LHDALKRHVFIIETDRCRFDHTASGVRFGPWKYRHWHKF